MPRTGYTDNPDTMDVFSLARVLVFAASGQGPFGQTANATAMLYRSSTVKPS